ncbi:MAG: polysaccharide deacetylase family protein [Desulfovibrio sp.]|jgi:peptidoglycan/xylan/chitin deacetylase (PgdA/CDA1 family)|nr:polysaccharide deacetylase family protein [Desulfovibrio sp.]
MRQWNTPVVLAALVCFWTAPFFSLALAGEKEASPLSPGGPGRDIGAPYAKAIPRQWGERLPGVVTRMPVPRQGPKVLFLTLDACGGRRGSGVDRGILELLREERIPAVIFVSSVWLRDNLALAKELAADGLFELAAHGTRHLPASVSGRFAYGIKGCTSVRALVEEVAGNVSDLAGLSGRRPLWYRSGTAFYDEVAIEVIHSLGLRVAGYTVSLDEGGTLPAAKVAEKALKAESGAILLCHLNRPGCATGRGLAVALPKLKAEGAIFLKLSDALPRGYPE